MKAVLYIRPTAAYPADRQRPRAERYIDENDIVLMKEVVEGKDFDGLHRAVKIADGRPVIIAYLGQLVKSPSFLKLLRKCNFVALGRPDIRPDNLDAAIQKAGELASRTGANIKNSLEALKKKGVPLGSSRPGATAGAKALRKHSGMGSKVAAGLRAQRTKDYYQFVMPRIVEMRQVGYTYEQIAQILNDEDLTMQNGGPYHEVAILRIKRRWEDENGKIATEFDKPGRRTQSSKS